ncbi:MAG: MarR family transcriptional regulator [Gammaproteobacteria bacterium]|nr:MarR family transcriptional regulator [Gammaproteobacteria bacterium]MBT8110392.1 MarR family transcriptional regulator [Gammaproteobacteria bacterium]NND46414.1 MarR family transcriptional regulator [Woeseiaceae bacterium]NNL45093.1 MarR family transcriptional regulator [Woeseiaceae bacterium]
MNCYSAWMKSGEKLEKTRGFDVWLAVGRTNLKVHRALNQSLGELDLSLAQHEILLSIWQKNGITQKQLAENLLVVKSNVSALIKKLESRGLVRRDCDPNDTRNKCLSLTEAGRKLVRMSFERQNKIIDAMASVMQDNELQMTGEVMTRVGKALDQLLTR